MVNFCGFRCATTSSITVFINVVFLTFIKFIADEDYKYWQAINKELCYRNAKSTVRPSCIVGVHVPYEISQEKICWWLINHFYVISHESYRNWRNNAKKWPLRRSKSFKVTNFSTNQKPTYDFLLVIITNLPCILHSFQSYGWSYVKFSLPIEGVLHFNASAGGDRLQISG